MATAIEFQNVGKMYRLGRVGTGTLSHDLNRWWQTVVMRREDPYLRIGEINDRAARGCSDYVWALKDISFQVNQGEIIGIIGNNGAGKSTLLKLLSHITSPTTGKITYQGRIASLLEVGTGFHPEMTGRENIYMNGSIMGMTKQEITRNLDEIVDFAGVERYLDTPVKRYSSGMTVRLAFSVAAFLEPEILTVDEVLTVGDAEFQKKALGKMQSVSQTAGRTVLFVSHNMSAVKSLCTRGLVLNQGQLAYDGNISDAVNFYMTHSINSLSDRRLIDGINYCQSILQITRISFNGTESSESTILPQQEYVDFELDGIAFEVLPDLDVRIQFNTPSGVPLAALVEGHYKGRTQTIQPGCFSLKRRVRLPLFLAEGDCVVDVYLHQPNACHYMRADACGMVHILGGVESYGQPLLQYRDGFFGLQAD